MTEAAWHELADSLNLDSSVDTWPGRAAVLRERLAGWRDDLAGMRPVDGVPTATLLRLRATKQAEMEACELGLLEIEVAA